MRIYPLLLIVFLSACSYHNPDKESTQAKMETTSLEVDTASVKREVNLPPYIDSIFGLEEFSSIPDTLTGCGDYYSLDSVREKQNHFLFLADASGFAMIRVHGEIIYLPQDTTVLNGLAHHVYLGFQDVYSKAYIGTNYIVRFDLKLIHANDEGGNYKGTLTVRHTNRVATYSIIGSTGC